jgi:hypothetical protein
MTVPTKPIEQISYSELLAHPVWEYVAEPDEDQDETWATPVSELPVSSLANRLVSSAVKLANGQASRALIGDLDTVSAAHSEHFLTVTIVKPNGERFHLARYHDPDYAESGPDALAAFLCLSRAEVFPIAFNVSDSVLGSADCLTGIIPYEPATRLSRSELIRLAVG